MPAKKKFNSLNVGLTAEDRARLAVIAKAKNKTITQISREAIRFYITHYDETQDGSNSSQVSKAITYATDQLVRAINGGIDRICKMLARQGRAVGTLYELAWMSLPDDEDARKAFEIAGTRAKQKMAKHVENDEKEFAERLKKVVSS